MGKVIVPQEIVDHDHVTVNHSTDAAINGNVHNDINCDCGNARIRDDDVEYKDQMRFQAGDVDCGYTSSSVGISNADFGRGTNVAGVHTGNNQDAAAIREYYKNRANAVHNSNSLESSGKAEDNTPSNDQVAITEDEEKSLVPTDSNSGVAKSENIEIANAYLVERDDEEANRKREEEIERTKKEAATLMLEKEVAVKQFLFWKRVALVSSVILISVSIALAVGIRLPRDKNKPPKPPSKSKPFMSTSELYDAVDVYVFSSDKENSIVSKIYGYPIGSWDVSRITNFSRVFNPNRNLVFDITAVDATYPFNDDISKWDVSSAVTMFSMFASATMFNQNISKWDVRRVTDFSGMFANAKDFNQDLSNWDTKNALTMSKMFYGADAFNGNIAAWNTSNVQDMSMMFKDAISFNQDVSNFDLSSVKDLSYMFLNSTSFEQNLCSWGSKLSVSSSDKLASITIGMLLNTSCPNTTSPVSFYGPWCTSC